MRLNKEVTELWLELEPEAKEFVMDRGELIMRLDKFIYGLKQSPYKFKLHLKATLEKLGYRVCE